MLHTQSIELIPKNKRKKGDMFTTTDNQIVVDWFPSTLSTSSKSSTVAAAAPAHEHPGYPHYYRTVTITIVTIFSISGENDREMTLITSRYYVRTTLNIWFLVNVTRESRERHPYTISSRIQLTMLEGCLYCLSIMTAARGMLASFLSAMRYGRASTSAVVNVPVPVFCRCYLCRCCCCCCYAAATSTPYYNNPSQINTILRNTPM